MKRFRSVHGLLALDGTPIRVPIKAEDRKVLEWGESTGDLFMLILNNAPIKTQNDSIQGSRLYGEIISAKDADFIEIEEGVHDWFKLIAEQITPVIFRLEANTVYMFIKEGFER